MAARLTRSGNIIGMTKAYAIVVHSPKEGSALVIETNYLDTAVVLGKELALKPGVSCEVHSSGGAMYVFDNSDTEITKVEGLPR